MAVKIREKKTSNEPSYVLKDLDKVAEIALFYGFTPVKTPKIDKKDFDLSSAISSDRSDPRDIFPKPEEKFSLLRTYTDWEMNNLPHPIMVHYRRPFGGSSVKRNPNEYHGALEIIGSGSSIAEAIAIKTTYSVLVDHGYKDLVVDINSIGDKDSIGRFEREIINYIRKHASTLPQELKASFRKDPFEACRNTHEKWVEFKEKIPQSMSCLSEPSVDHFQEVLEYLETSEIPYRINHGLIGNRHFCSHTLFEIRSSSETEPELFAIGTRHNHIAKKFGFKKDIPIVSVNIRFKKPAVSPKLFFRVKPRPKFYFIQFGTIAKLKSLSVIELLRQARIPVHHSLTRDKFVGQLTSAESLRTPFIIIMGQKEALEDTVVVRHMLTRSQDIVPVPNLANYLSKLS